MFESTKSLIFLPGDLIVRLVAVELIEAEADSPLSAIARTFKSSPGAAKDILTGRRAKDD